MGEQVIISKKDFEALNKIIYSKIGDLSLDIFMGNVDRYETRSRLLKMRRVMLEEISELLQLTREES